MAWLRNDGAQNFTQSVLIPEIGDDFRFGTISYRQGKVSVAVADMDGDGDLDIITNTDGDVYGAEWWENDGGVDPILVDDHLIKVQPSIDDDEGMLGPFEVHDVDRDGLVVWSPITSTGLGNARTARSNPNTSVTGAKT